MTGRAAWDTQLGLGDVRLSDVVLGTAAVGAVLASASGQGDVDLASISIPVQTLKEMGVDTAELEKQGITTLSLESLGITTDTLQSMGVATTTLSLSALGIDATQVTSATSQLFSALNLNTLGGDIDRALAQAGLQIRQGDVYLNRLGAEKLDAQPGDVIELYIGPIPVPFRVRAIVDQSGPMGALAPVAMLRLDEAQKLLFMRGKVNNVLISNLGDNLSGVDQTDAVSKRLRVLALDEDTLAGIAAVLRRPDVRAVVDDAAPRVADTVAADLQDAGPFASIIESLGQMQDYMAQVRALPAALDEPGIGDGLRAALANTSVREWLLGLSLPADAKSELQAGFRRSQPVRSARPAQQGHRADGRQRGGHRLHLGLLCVRHLLDPGRRVADLLDLCDAGCRTAQRVGHGARHRHAAQPSRADVRYRRAGL